MGEILYTRSYDDYSLTSLVGRLIVAISAIGDEYIRFTTTTGELVYMVEGDCCSSSWIEEIYNVDALLGATVASVEDLPVEGGEATRQEYDQVYGIKITTDKGVAKLVHRNSSNGYYGGSLERVIPSDDAGVYGFAIDESAWVNILQSLIKTQ